MKPKSEAAAAQNKEHEATASAESQLQPAESPSREEIRQRAYEIHIERGGGHGQDTDDWLQAERELRAKYRAG